MARPNRHIVTLPSLRWIQLAFTCLFLALHVVAQQPDWDQSLFSASDPVMQLWANNFTEGIYGKPHMTIVMFYAAWCGHCRRTAPIFKSFADNVKCWSPVLKVASVSCSDSYNSELCRKLEIRGYPSVKFFPPNSERTFIGTPSTDVQDAYNSNDMRLGTLEYLQQHLDKIGTHPTWPQLQRASTNGRMHIHNLREIRSDGATQVFVVVEDSSMSTDHVGLGVELNMIPSLPGVVVRRMTQRDSGQRDPGLYLLTARHDLLQVSRSVGEEEIVNEIKRRIGSRGDNSFSSYGSYITTLPPSLSRATYNPSTYRPNRLHMRDLESSLYRTLWMEIPAEGDIEGDRLQALKAYVQLLDQFHPGEQHVRRYLQKLQHWLSHHQGSLLHTQWIDQLNSLQTSDSYIPQNEVYTGCAGSSPGLRGYTCSLWMTFHTLTVNAYRMQGSDRYFHPTMVLYPIRDYIRYFFSCRECAEHFGEMARAMSGEIRDVRDVVLWLWRAHNRVNRRLHGVVQSEDPRAPKLQFPTPFSCRACYRPDRLSLVDPFSVEENDWNVEGVMDYLMDYYSQSRIIDDHDESSDAPAPGVRGQGWLLEDRCPRQQTDWTPCSRTCDVGLSTRMVSELVDGSCKLVQETRWCFIKPCNVRLTDWSVSAWHIDNCPRMAHTYRLTRPRTLSYGNCTTVTSESWKICGQCPRSRRGRPICCRPSQTITRPIEVTCRVSEAGTSNVVARRASLEARGVVNVEEIQSCVCDEDCSRIIP